MLNSVVPVRATVIPHTSMRMGLDVVDLGAIDRTQVALAGGKGASLGELSRIEGIRVPAGFCVTTGAFRRVVAAAPGIDAALDRLSRLGPGDLEEIRAVSGEARRTIEALAIPDDLRATIVRSLAALGENAAYAVRSSATAEDLPTASSRASTTRTSTWSGRRRSSGTSAGAGRHCSPSGPSRTDCGTA